MFKIILTLIVLFSFISVTELYFKSNIRKNFSLYTSSTQNTALVTTRTQSINKIKHDSISSDISITTIHNSKIKKNINYKYTDLLKTKNSSLQDELDNQKFNTPVIKNAHVTSFVKQLTTDNVPIKVDLSVKEDPQVKKKNKNLLDSTHDEEKEFIDKSYKSHR